MENQMVLTLKECAAILKISLPTMYHLADSADFPVVRVSPRRRIVYAPAFETWLKSKSAQSTGSVML